MEEQPTVIEEPSSTTTVPVRTERVPPPTEPPVVATSGPPKMSWGAIFGGAVAAISIWAMLGALGLGLGLSPLNPMNPDVRAMGMFTGIWNLITPLVALFIGGFVASRGAGAVDRGGGALHGFVVWGLTTVLGAWLLVNLVGGMLGGVATLGRTATEATRGGQSFGLDANDALAPINGRLHAEGKPEITPDQLQKATNKITRDALRTGRVDHETLVRDISQSTNLSRADAEDVANRVERQVDDAKNSVAQGAAQAAKTTGDVMWGVFGALLLGLLAALLGGALGVSRAQRVWASRVLAREPLTNP